MELAAAYIHLKALTASPRDAVDALLQAAKALEIVIGSSVVTSNVGSHRISLPEQFEVVIGGLMVSSNQFCTTTGEGCFEVKNSHGVMPLLLLLKTQDVAPENDIRIIFSTSAGEALSTRTPGDLKHFFTVLGFSQAEYLEHCYALELLKRPFNFKELISSVEDAFF